MMRRQLDDLHAERRSLAALYASEGAIYGRFGYGVGAYASRFVLDKRRVRLGPEPDREQAPGSLRIVESADALEACRAVYQAYVPTRAGEIDRVPGAWSEIVPDPADTSSDAKERFFVLFELDGRIDGYAVYRMAPVGPPGRSGPDRRAVFVEEHCALSPLAGRSLWRFLVGVDLTDEVRTRGRPVDDPVRYLSDDPRAVRTTDVYDRIWVRLVEVESALEMRAYSSAGSLVLQVADAFCSWNEGCYRLSVDADGRPTVERAAAGSAAPNAAAKPDLVLDVAQLGAIYLGGVRPSDLASAGRIVEVVPGAARRADAIFVGEIAPYCTASF